MCGGLSRRPRHGDLLPFFIHKTFLQSTSRLSSCQRTRHPGVGVGVGGVLNIIYQSPRKETRHHHVTGSDSPVIVASLMDFPRRDQNKKRS